MNTCIVRDPAQHRFTGFLLRNGDSDGSLDSRRSLRSFAAQVETDFVSAFCFVWLVILLIVVASAAVFHVASIDRAEVPGTPPTSGPFSRAGLKSLLKAPLVWLLITLGFFVGMACAVFAGVCGRRAWRVLARGFTVVLLAAALLAPQALAAAPAAGAVGSAPSAWSAQPVPAGAWFAAIDLKQAIRSFLEFLGWVLILVGVCLVAYGAILLAQGRHFDGIVAVVSGFILVLSIPMIEYFAGLAGIQF
jgi:hypothetical protein